MDRPRIPKAVSGRLSLYHRQLESCLEQDETTISSIRLAERLGLTAAQVRKDLAYFGQFGHPGVGYKVEPLMKEIRKILGTNREWKVALVGMGNLGTALVRHKGFSNRGFRIAALFDADPEIAGQKVDGLVVHEMAKLEDQVRKSGIRLGIIAVPAPAAQDVAERLGRAGVEGILNFAPVSLDLPDGVDVANVDMAIELEQLTYTILNKREDE